MKREKRAEPKGFVDNTPARAASDLPIKEHILMVNDLPRGQKYYDAMKAKIRPGDVVLEVGTGAGLLSCLAARLGASHVYTVEQSPVLHQVARNVVEANGLSDKITLINAHSRDLHALGVIKEPIDVFVTETIGTQGLDEGILPIFEDVKQYLTPKAKVIPESVRFRHCLVNMSGIREQVEILHPVLGVDMSPLNNEVKSNNLYWMHAIELWREVSTTGHTPEFDLLDFTPAECTQTLEIISDNICDGMLNWAEFQLAENVLIETRYRYFGSSWANSIHFMPRGQVNRGQTCTAQLRFSDSRLSWVLNWKIEAG
jgi:type II protein arginine methyltransferase